MPTEVKDPFEGESLATVVGSYARTDDIVERALKTDPLLSAEKVTGKSYKEDPETDRLGFALAMEHNQRKDAILRSTQDTTYSSTLEEFLAVVEDIGFKVVAKRPFEHTTYGDSEPVTLHNFVLVHPEGVLMIFDTYKWGDNSEKINAGHMFYNWRPNEKYRAMREEYQRWAGAIREVEDKLEFAEYYGPEDPTYGLTEEQDQELRGKLAYLKSLPQPPYPPNVTSSGGYRYPDDTPQDIPNPDYEESRRYELHWKDPRSKRVIPNPEFDQDKLVYVGHHYLHEAVRFNFNQLREWGEFITPWIEMPWSVDTLDIDESKARYQYGTSGTVNSVGRDTWDEWSWDERHTYRIARDQVAKYIELCDRVRWPMEMINLIGTEALVREDRKDEESFARELERCNVERDTILQKTAEFIEELPPVLRALVP